MPIVIVLYLPKSFYLETFEPLPDTDESMNPFLIIIKEYDCMSDDCMSSMHVWWSHEFNWIMLIEKFILKPDESIYDSCKY